MRAYKQYNLNLSVYIDEKELNKQLTHKNLFQYNQNELVFFI